MASGMYPYGSYFYSSAEKVPAEVVPANTQSHYAPAEGCFSTSYLLQHDVLMPIPEAPPSLKTGLEISLSSIVSENYFKVGQVSYEGVQVGSCTLIGRDLAIIPYHCIEELAINQLEVTFGKVLDPRTQRPSVGFSFAVDCVVEWDPKLDYAILRINGDPGGKLGFFTIDHHATAVTEPALLHYPYNQPLKVSVNKMLHSPYEALSLQVYHDSDYGSSGGAYVNPASAFVAMHLGTERRETAFNSYLVRLALPIENIIQSNPWGILARIANKTFDPHTFFPEHKDKVCFLPFVLRAYIDLEKFEQKNLILGNYIVKQPKFDSKGKLLHPGVIIDSHQVKHALFWPGNFLKGGTTFPHDTFTKDDIVDIAEALAETPPF